MEYQLSPTLQENLESENGEASKSGDPKLKSGERG